MLRISTQPAADRMVMKLEGRLVDAWVREADTSWQSALADAGTRPIVIDLCEVYAIDDAGRDLLARMYRGGADLWARGCLMRETVREIVEAVARAGRLESPAERTFRTVSNEEGRQA